MDRVSGNSKLIYDKPVRRFDNQSIHLFCESKAIIEQKNELGRFIRGCSSNRDLHADLVALQELNR